MFEILKCRIDEKADKEIVEERMKLKANGFEVNKQIALVEEKMVQQTFELTNRCDLYFENLQFKFD